MTHTFASDIELSLISPGGTSVSLMWDDGGSSGLDAGPCNFNFIVGGQDPDDWDFAGDNPDPCAGDSFDPALEPQDGGLGFADLDGEGVTGIWTLEVTDDAGGDTGSFTGWSLNFNFLGGPIGDPPIITCPLDIVIDSEPGVCAAVANFAGTAFDPEDGVISGDIVYTQDSGTSFNVGTTVVTASVTDSDGNTSTCDFSVTVNDVEDPTLTCMDITVELDALGDYILTPGEVVMDSDDNCGIVSTDIMVPGINPVASPVVPFNFNATGIIETDVTIVNPGNSDADVTVSVEFTGDFGGTGFEELVIEGPDGSTVLTQSGNGGVGDCATATTSFTVAQATWNGWITTFGPDITFTSQPDVDVDNICPSSELQLTAEIRGLSPVGSFAFDCDDVGPNDVIVQVTDAAGNTAQCTVVVTVEDNIAPVIACVGSPTPLTGNASDDPAVAIPGVGSPAVTTTIDVTDDFDITDLNVDLDIDHTWIGDIVVTLQSPSGTTVTLLDQVGVPASTFGCNNVDPNIVITLDDESADPAEDNCPEPYVGTFSPFGSLADFDGESTLGTWTLSIEDLVAGDDTNNFINEWGITYTYETTGTPLEVDLDANGMASIPASSLLLGVDEACGFTVTVATDPGLTGLTTLFNSNNGGALGGAVYFDVTVGPADVTLNGFETNTEDPGAFSMEVYAIEGGTYVGNEADPAPWTLVGTATGDASGTVDVPSPATLDAPITLLANTTYAMALVMDADHGHNYTNGDGTNESYSNADLSIDLGSGSNTPFAGPTFNPRVWNGTLVYESTVPGSSETLDLDCSNLGENQIEVTVTDDSGNESTCIATVNVNDVTDPILVCQDITVSLDENGMAEIEPEDLLANGPDIFNLLVIGSDNTSGTAGTTDFTVAITDAATVEFDWLYTTTDIPGFDRFGYLLNGVFTELADTDGQSGSESISVVPGDVFGFRSETDDNDFGENQILISNFMPGFEGQFDQANWNLTLDNSDGSADFILEVPGGPLSFDACGITVLAIDIDEFTCDDIGTPVVVTVFASDASGNLAACTATVTVVDDLGPEITCPADQTVDPGPNNLQYEVPDYWANGEATAVDNCTDPLTIFTQDPAPGTLLEDGTYTVTLGSEDEYGNVSTCTFELTVESILGQTDNPLANGITIYPNPADAQVTLANNSGIQLERAQIFDVNGRLVMNLNISNMGTERTIDVSQLATGAYLVQLEGEGQTATKRLIKR